MTIMSSPLIYNIWELFEIIIYILRGFVKLKNSKKPRKTRKWVGGSSLNSDFNVFLCCFHVPKCFTQKKLDSGVDERGMINPSFSRIFGFF